MLLLDEPLSALDAKVRTQLRDEIRRVQLDVGTTTLFVTHDQEEALAVADRVGVMSQGRLEQLDPAREVYADPATPFVAEFVGLNNKVPAHVASGRAELLGTSVPTLTGSIDVRCGHGDAAARVGDRDRRPGGHVDGQVGGVPRADLAGVRRVGRRHRRRRAAAEHAGPHVRARFDGDRRRRADGLLVVPAQTS